MSKDRSAEDGTPLTEMEAAAAELVDTGRELFKKVEPTHPHPEVQPRYRLFKRVEAPLALLVGPERAAALRAALIEKH